MKWKTRESLCAGNKREFLGSFELFGSKENGGGFFGILKSNFGVFFFFKLN